MGIIHVWALFSNIIFIKPVFFFIEIFLKFVVRTNDKKSTLVQVMAWSWTGNKPSPETILTSV